LKPQTRIQLNSSDDQITVRSDNKKTKDLTALLKGKGELSKVGTQLRDSLPSYPDITGSPKY
jgi:hypothetical protein